jgi:hypothetical protein
MTSSGSSFNSFADFFVESSIGAIHTRVPLELRRQRDRLGLP